MDLTRRGIYANICVQKNPQPLCAYAHLSHESAWSATAWTTLTQTHWKSKLFFGCSELIKFVQDFFQVHEYVLKLWIGRGGEGISFQNYKKDLFQTILNNQQLQSFDDPRCRAGVKKSLLKIFKWDWSGKCQLESASSKVSAFSENLIILSWPKLKWIVFPPQNQCSGGGGGF